jgi:hypothetical protein
MRAEIHGSGLSPARSRTDERCRSAAQSRSRRRLDPFELLALGAFAAMSMWVLALDLHRASVHGLVWTGTDGFYIVDQMQYLAWIRDASHHVLVSNLFVLRDTPADYFQPAVVISGALTALGLAPWLALLLWKPVAVLVIFYGFRAYVGRSLAGIWSRRAALVLGLFFGSYTVIYGSLGVLGDLFAPFLSWGYTFGLLAIGVMLLALVSYDRARRSSDGARDRAAWAPGALGALASLLHPWQGELLILIVAFSELALWRSERRARGRVALPLITVVATGAPLLYYAILGRADLSWRLARIASKHSFSLTSILLGIAPLLILGLLAWRPRPRSFIATATRAWPLAALAIYVLSASDLSATPLHAFNGITFPLAVLAVEGLQRVRIGRLLEPVRIGRLPLAPAIGVLAMGAATVPASVYMLQIARRIVTPAPGSNADFIHRDENRALHYLAKNGEPGGVLTQPYLGAAVPGETGRRTFVGDCLWSEPGCLVRSKVTYELFKGGMQTAGARTLVRQTGARFVLADCTTTADMRKLLAPMTRSVHSFGCATVYELDAPGSPTGPLAQSALHAALRAPGRQQRRVQSS